MAEGSSAGAGGRMRRNIAPRTTQQYDSRKARETRSGNMAGLFQNIFNPKAGRVMTFQGFGDQGERSVFRPFAPLDFADPSGTLAPGRISFDPGHYSHWQQCFMVAKWIGLRDEGCQKVSLLLGRPGDGEWAKRPYRMLYKRIADAKRGKIVDGLANRFNVQWLQLLEGDSRGGAELTTPNEMFFIQSAVYKGAVYDMEKKKNVFTDFLEQRGVPMGLKAEDPLPVFVLTKGTGFKLISGHEATSKREAIDSLLDLRRENYDPDSQEVNEVFFYGDPVGTFDPTAGTLTGGVFVSLFMPFKNMEVPPYSTWTGEIEEFQGYEAQVTRKYRTPDKQIIDASLGKEAVDQIFNKAQFWDESAPGAEDGLVRLPSVEEECVLVANAFKKQPKLLHYAWADRPEWFTDDVKGILGQRATLVDPQGRTGDDEDDAVVDDEPAPAAAPRRDRTVAGAASQRPAVGATARRAAPRPEPEPPADDADLNGDDAPDYAANGVGYGDGEPGLTAADDAELFDTDEPEPGESDELDPEPEPEPAPAPAPRTAPRAARPAAPAQAQAAPAQAPAAPQQARRPAAAPPVATQTEDDDFFGDSTPAAPPPKPAKPAAPVTGRAAKPPAEDADVSEAVAGDPVLSAQAAETEAGKRMAAAKAAATRAGARGSPAAAPPKQGAQAKPPAPAQAPAAPPAKGGAAARRPR